MSTSQAYEASSTPEQPKYPPTLVVNVVPSTPPAKGWEPNQDDVQSRPSHEESGDLLHLRAPDATFGHEHREQVPISSGSQTQILTAIIIGVSCPSFHRILTAYLFILLDVGPAHCICRWILPECH